MNVNFSKLQMEIHEGALVPGIFLPSINPEVVDPASRQHERQNHVTMGMLLSFKNWFDVCIQLHFLLMRCVF